MAALHEQAGKPTDASGAPRAGLQLSVGHGRRSTRAARHPVAGAHSLAAFLDGHRGTDAWWSPHTWKLNHRQGDAWDGACAFVVDIDFHNEAGEHTEPPDEGRAKAEVAAGALSATAFHHTPRGARVIWLLKETWTQQVTWQATAKSLCESLARELAGSGLSWDAAASCDAA